MITVVCIAVAIGCLAMLPRCEQGSTLATVLGVMGVAACIVGFGAC